MGLCSLMAPGVLAHSGEPSVTTRDWIAVVGPDGPAVLAIDSLAHRIRRETESRIPWPRELGDPVSIQLVPLSPDQTEYRVSPASAGGWRLELPWSAATTRETTLIAVTDLILRRLAHWHGGPGNARQLPPWLIRGFALQVAASINPARVDALAARGRQRGPGTLSDLVAPESPDETTAMRAFWLIRALDRVHPDGTWLRAILAGTPVESLLLPGGLPPGQTAPEAWWTVHFLDLTGSRHGPCDPADRSLRELEAAAEFFLVRNGRESIATPVFLWDLRSEPATRAEIEHRLRHIRTALPRAHPLCHNAWLSLGIVFEELLAGRKREFLLALEQADRDRRQAQQHIAAVATLLQ